jgi:hypothetical protein
MDVTRKLIAMGLLLLVTLVTGFWRGNAGNPALSGTVHKLLGLACVIYSAIVLYHTARPIQFGTAYYAAIAVLLVSMVALIASGSLLTVPRANTTAWLALHRIASALAAIAAFVTARLLILSKP